MNGWAVLSLAGAILGSAVAVIAGSDETTAVPAGLLAVASAAVFAILLLSERADWRVVDSEPAGGAPLSILVEGFRGNPLGRQAVVGAVASLERDLPPGERPSLSLREEQELLAGSPAEFDAWVRSHLDRLEREM
ncbi:MAG: hypothetical protein L3K15_00595 [Thermoplasmata archaeon]|nr:hypothetical protein [Thermoplasmata archaeon]